MKIFLLTAHFRPNIGGVETHLDDLCKVLLKRNFKVTVLTYRPLQTVVSWELVERRKNLDIFRIPWVPDLFYRLLKKPILEFLYLTPGLFFVTPIFLALRKPDVISAHGLVAGFVSVFWGKVFKVKTVVATHSIYSFPKKGLFRKFAEWIFRNATFCLGLSKQSVEEIKSLGVNSKKIDNFTYWIDLGNFRRVKNAKRNLGWKEKFVVLFVGRLVKEKGLDVLLRAAKIWNKKIDLKIAGFGPMVSLIKREKLGFNNIEYIGGVSQDRLPEYLSGSDILIVPSTSEEGFGRVILESLACGTPVIGANRGAIPQTLDSTVGRIIDISGENIKECVEHLYLHKDELRNLAKNCRKFAERRYSEKNAEAIIRAYKK